MKRFGLLLGLSISLVLGPALNTAAIAQDASDLSAEEIKELFNKQKTRGLVIVPSGQNTPAVETSEVNVAATPEYVAVEEPDQVNIRISFDFDSAALREDQKPKLSTLCQVMQSVDVQLFQIIGHTDSSGTAAYNEHLSLLRAQEVKRFLVGDCGIAETRLNAVGVGESHPFDAADPRSDENRRVEFQALS